MQIHRRRLLLFALAATLSPAAAAQDFDLGREWHVREQASDGSHWDGVWTRRGYSNTFDAEWQNSASDRIVRDVIEFMRVEQNSVVLHRLGNNGRYFGELSPDGRRIVRGTASWYKPESYWTARIVGR
ncbi:MAG: hypothetical protein ACLQIQ_05195 [Beijerinckiaceae bacterium]